MVPFRRKVRARAGGEVLRFDARPTQSHTIHMLTCVSEPPRRAETNILRIPITAGDLE